MSVILVPVDGSSHALKALHIASDLADKYGAEVALLHVIGAHADQVPDDQRDLLKTRANEILQQAEAKVQHRGVKFRVLDIEIGDPAEAILIAARKVKPSTIVMGCRGASETARNSFGSVSQLVFQRSDCTCISVK